MADKIQTNNGLHGGMLHGKTHDDGGIKAVIVTDNNRPVELEGGEVIITKKAVTNNEKRLFEGEELTNKEILSRINQSGGGVPIYENGGIIGHGAIRNYDEVELMPIDEVEKFLEFDRTGKDAFLTSPEVIAEVENSIRKHGFKEPLIITYFQLENKALLEEGNHRFVAAKRLGLKELPVRVIRTKRGAFGDKAKNVSGYTADDYGYVPANLSPSQIGISARKPVKKDYFADGGTLELFIPSNEKTREKYTVAFGKIMPYVIEKTRADYPDVYDINQGDIVLHWNGADFDIHTVVKNNGDTLDTDKGTLAEDDTAMCIAFRANGVQHAQIFAEGGKIPTGVTVSHNTTQNGVEVKFASKPTQEILDLLKQKSFRWSKYSKVWYKKYTPALFKEISEYFEQELSEDVLETETKPTAKGFLFEKELAAEKAKPRPSYSRLLKRELTAKFPNINFSVRYDSFAGGDSIDVYYSNGPDYSEINDIAEKYEKGRYDSLTEIYNYKGQNYGAKYVMTHRQISEDVFEQIAKFYAKQNGLQYVDLRTYIPEYNSNFYDIASLIVRNNGFDTSDGINIEDLVLVNNMEQLDYMYKIKYNGGKISTNKEADKHKKRDEEYAETQNIKDKSAFTRLSNKLNKLSWNV